MCLVTPSFLPVPSEYWNQTGCSSEYHFYLYGEKQAALSFAQVSVWNRVIIKRCNEVWSTLFQGTVAKIPHKLWGRCLIKEISHCLSTIMPFGVDLSELSRDSFLICRNHRSSEETVTPPRWSERGCCCKTWHFDPMGSAKLRLKSLKHWTSERMAETDSLWQSLCVCVCGSSDLMHSCKRCRQPRGQTGLFSVAVQSLGAVILSNICETFWRWGPPSAADSRRGACPLWLSVNDLRWCTNQLLTPQQLENYLCFI